MARMQLNASIKSLISIACLLVLHQNVTASFYDPASHVESHGLDYSAFSASAQPVVAQIYPYGPQEHMEYYAGNYLHQSKTAFDELLTKIHDSVQRGNIIHVEDGEGDDILHNLLQFSGNIVPRQVYMHNGYYKVRGKAANNLWSYLHQKLPIDKPEIFTLRGGLRDSISSFDRSEGHALIPDQELEILRDQSFPPENDEQLYTPEHEQARQTAQDKLLHTLRTNDFTTIVLKTAPGGLTDILKQEDFRNKVAIVWTGPIRKLAKSNRFEAKFNLHRSLAESDELLASGLPIVVVSPYLGDAEMSALVDSKFIEIYKEYEPALRKDFEGLPYMASIPDDKTAMVSYYINQIAEKMMDNTITFMQPEEDDWNARMSRLQQSKPHLHPSHYEEQLENLENEGVSTLSLIRRWKILRQKALENGQKFREYCPVDLYAAAITDPSLRSSVTEVLQVEIKSIEPTGGAKTVGVNVTPSYDSNIFITSGLDSKLLMENLIKILKWFHDGEPSLRQNEQLSREYFPKLASKRATKGKKGGRRTSRS